MAWGDMAKFPAYHPQSHVANRGKWKHDRSEHAPTVANFNFFVDAKKKKKSLNVHFISRHF